MLLIWIITDQLKREKECKRLGIKPAVTMRERLLRYLMGIILPIILGIVVLYLRKL